MPLPPRRLWHRYPRFWGGSPDADVDDELRFHMEMRERDLRARGIPERDAGTQARRLFGDVDIIRGECAAINRRLAKRSARGATMRGLLSDIRHAVRMLRHAPAFTAVAVATLGLGIGANTVVFSLVDAVVLRPMPGVRQPEQLFDVVTTPLSYPALRDQQAADGGVADIAAFRARRLAVRTGDDASMRGVEMVSGNYFSLVGARARLGRLLGPADDAPDAPPAAVVSDDFWRKQLGADRAALGRSMFVSGARVTIVGVTEPAFRGTRLVNVPDVWVPIAVWPAIRPSGLASLDISNRGWGWLQVMGRLRAGATLARAQAAVVATAKREAELYPNVAPSSPSLELRPSVTSAAGGGTHKAIVQFMIVLSSVAAMVLLIACVNIANLLLARHTQRRAEIAVRVALGATQFRLIRQLLTEALVLGALASGAAVAFASVALHALRAAVLPGGLSLSVVGATLDTPALLVGLAVALLTTLLVGVVPAVHAARDTSGASLRERSGTGSFATARLRDTLLVAQVAMSLVLLIGAGLFVRGLQRALSIDLGFQPEHLATAAVNTGLVRYDTARAERYLVEGASRIAALPGVTHVAWTATLPLSGHNALGASIEGFAPTAGKQREPVTVDIVGPGYLATIGARLVRGRDLSAADRVGAPPVCVVNEAFARHYWPGQNPLGKRILIEDSMTVVGVANDVKAEQLSEDPVPIVYQSVAQQRRWMLDEMHVAVRTAGDPDLLVPSIVRALRQGGADVPVYEVSDVGERLDELLTPQRLGAQLLGAFGVLALIVSGVGIYGVVSYMVGQRTREIGIRIALGASARSVLSLVMGQNLARLAVGIGIGLALAALTTRVAATFLFGLSARDGLTYAGMSVVLALVGALAAYLPARRATRVDPVRALRID